MSTWRERSDFAPGSEADLWPRSPTRTAPGLCQTHLVIDLPSTMTLLGPPAYDRGSGVPAASGSTASSTTSQTAPRPGSCSRSVSAGRRPVDHGRRVLRPRKQPCRQRSNAVTPGRRHLDPTPPPRAHHRPARPDHSTGTAKANCLLGHGLRGRPARPVRQRQLNGGLGNDKLYGGPGTTPSSAAADRTSSMADPEPTRSTPRRPTRHHPLRPR